MYDQLTHERILMFVNWSKFIIKIIEGLLSK